LVGQHVYLIIPPNTLWISIMHNHPQRYVGEIVNKDGRSSNFTPQVNKARNQLQIFNRKSTSRNITHRQSYHLQEILTGETLKDQNKYRESKQPQDCNEKTAQIRRTSVPFLFFLCKS